MQVPTGEEIQKARKANGLFQSAVAEEAGVSQPLVSRVENGDIDPRLSTLHSLSLAITGSGSGYSADRLEVVVPDAIQNRREQSGLTQRELAEAAGVSQPLISRIEGKSVDPRASTLRSVLGALDDREGVDTTTRESEPSDRSIPERESSENRGTSDVLAEIEAEFDKLQQSITD
jgi:predicted transcriptional regulator